MSISIIKDGKKNLSWLTELIGFAKLIHLRFTNVHQLKVRLMDRSHCMEGAFYFDEALWYNFFFLSWNWFWNLYDLQALLTDCKAIGLYQQDEGCPAESKGGGRMPSVWEKTPTEPWHIRRISNMEIGTGEFQKSPQVLQRSQALDIAIKKRFWSTHVSAEYLTKQLWFFINKG